MNEDYILSVLYRQVSDDSPTPTTPLAEARRLQEQWDQESAELEGEELREEAFHAINSLVTLVAAAEQATVVQASGPPQRDYQFDGMDHCPSFAIMTRGPDVQVVINPKLWQFDQPSENMSAELLSEVMAPLQRFVHDKLDESTIHAMASALRGQLERLVHEGRIIQKPI